jgi:hypothetical protein
MAERWLRLNATWGESEWLIVLPPLQRLTWIEILCWVKLRGVAGRCRRPSTASVRVRTGVPEADIEALEKAAVEAEALAIEGDEWVIVKWDKYQKPDPTSAQRQRKYRKEKSRLSPLRRDKAFHSVTVRDPSRDVDIDEDIEDNPSVSSANATETDGGAPKKKSKRATRIPNGWSAKTTHRDKAEGLGLDLDREEEAFIEHANATGRTLLDWDAGFSVWLGRARDFKPRGTQGDGGREDLSRFKKIPPMPSIDELREGWRGQRGVS